MSNRKNSLTPLDEHALTASTGKQRSLVARGINALKNMDDIIYRQARTTYNKLTDDGAAGWTGHKEREIPLTKVFEVFQTLADKGYGKAFFPLAMLYGGNQCIEYNSVQEGHFLRLACDWLQANEHLNDVEIWYDLGVLQIGENDELAAHWFQKGADAEDPSCMWMLSGAYEFGEGVEQDWSKSLFWQIKAAMQGHVKAQHGLEIQHHHGDLDIEDEKVFDWYIWSAKQGYIWAQVCLADAFFFSFDNENQAAYWYEKAASQGDPHAQLQIGTMYWNLKSYGVVCNGEKAEFWLEKAANQGAPEAQYEFAKFLDYKLYSLPFDEAVEYADDINCITHKLVQCAATQGYGPAQYDIVRDISFPNMTESELAILFDNALSWYQNRVESSDSPELRFDYALIHLDNCNTNHNIFRKASLLDGLNLLREIVSSPIIIDVYTLKPLPSEVQLRALIRLGDELLKAHSDKKEVAEAIGYLLEAANANDTSSMRMLSDVYEIGRGVEQDWEKARYWQIKAVLSGHTEMQRGLDHQVNFNEFDSDLWCDIYVIAGIYIQSGAIMFRDYSKSMINNLGNWVEPFLPSIYLSIKYDPGVDSKGMTPASEIDHILTNEQTKL